MNVNRAYVAFAHDVIMAAVAFVLSMYLRVGDAIIYYDMQMLVLGTIVFTLVSASVFWSMRMYRGVWRYASLPDLITITKSASLAVLIFVVIMFATTRLEDLPRSLPVINWFILIALLGGPRFIYRLFKDRGLDWSLYREGDTRVPVLLAGAGDGAEMFIRAMNRPGANYHVVGIVARTGGRVGRGIHDVQVMGTVDDIATIVKQLERRAQKPSRVIVTADTFDGIQLQKLLQDCDSLGMTLARMPALTDFRKSVDGAIEVRPVDVEDLLGRPQKALNREPVRALIKDRRVLVTGAGGSIGSELVRQISDLGPAHLILIDASEYNLFNIDREVDEKWPHLARTSLIADVRDRTRITKIFADERPELVFHAAALKHVPLVETNVFEGMATNVIGTKNVADASRDAGVRAVVQISTDKAVNPTSMMGASKRIAEIYCQALNAARKETDPEFITVRFGNVLGSTGSVVELFREQLAKGGPLTVTHPDMKRYFMTIREAVELVLQASALGSQTEAGNGEIFVLDMGEPVKIVDLAKQMIRLAGLRVDEDVKIDFIGLRPGEKLFEEIFHGGEPLVPTRCEGLLLALPRTMPLPAVEAELQSIDVACKEENIDRVMAATKTLVPEYQGARSVSAKASAAE